MQLKLGLLRELDQFQSARLYFCSYPACPDVVALVKCAAGHHIILPVINDGFGSGLGLRLSLG